MDVLNFAKEYSRLVIRYTKAPSLSDNNSLERKPLTYEEIVNTTRNVHLTVFNVNKSNNDYLSIETLSNEINAITSTEPIVEKINESQNDEITRRFKDTTLQITQETQKTQNIQDTPTHGSSNLDLLSNTNNKEDVKDTFDILRNNKKFISRSTPEIHIENLNRSDTFIREKCHNTNNAAQITGMIEPLLQSVNDVQQINAGYMKQLNKIIKEIQAQRNQLLRTMMNKKDSELKNTFSGIPISSKLTIMAKKNEDKRKSIGGIVTQKLAKPVTVIRSTSDLNLLTNDEPLHSKQSVNKPVKYSKYAHVKSTIPKPMTHKRTHKS